MSGGYADRLTKGVDFGECGAPERQDNTRVMTSRINKLVSLIQKSKYIVAHTGAGISTSSGIPDFRGPRGIWTLENKGEKIDPVLDRPWESVKPTLAHRALLALHKIGKLKFIISQNVDSLHLRSGYPRNQLAELHGNVFKEVCPKCTMEYYQPFDVKGIGFKPTGRLCTNGHCKEPLVDDLLDWEDALEDEALEEAEIHCSKADLALCLGTSLKVQPASELPLITSARGGQIVIINLQATPKDGAALKIHGYVDEVMAQVMEKLGLEIPEYDPEIDFVLQQKTLQYCPSVKKEEPKSPTKKTKKEKQVKKEKKEDDTDMTEEQLNKKRSLGSHEMESPKKKVKKETSR